MAVLRSGAGAYVREFGACYQKTVPIGACAAVVNTTGGTVAMPSLSRTYTHALVLNDASSFTTGTAARTGSAPASLGAMTAVVLLQ